jgi:hypothetical protein
MYAMVAEVDCRYERGSSALAPVLVLALAMVVALMFEE